MAGAVGVLLILFQVAGCWSYT